MSHPTDTPPPTPNRTASRLAHYYAVLEKCRQERHRDPEKLKLRAAQALYAAHTLPREDFLPGAVEDLIARALAEQGNASRILDEFQWADHWFGAAFAARERGTGSRALLADLVFLHASLNIHRGNYAAAFEELDLAYLINTLELARPHEAGEALVKKGLAKSYANEPEEAIDLVRRGLALIDPERDPQLHLAAVHNLLWFFVAAGSFTEGRRLLAEQKPLYTRHATPLHLLKLRWVEGKIAAGLGERKEAEAAFLAVRLSYVRRKMGLDAALVSLDLAALWLGQGRFREIGKLAAKMIAVFERLHIGREAIAVWILVENAARQERATVALMEHTAERLGELLRSR